MRFTFLVLLGGFLLASCQDNPKVEQPPEQDTVSQAPYEGNAAQTAVPSSTYSGNEYAVPGAPPAPYGYEQNTYSQGTAYEQSANTGQLTDQATYVNGQNPPTHQNHNYNYALDPYSGQPVQNVAYQQNDPSVPAPQNKPTSINNIVSVKKDPPISKTVSGAFNNWVLPGRKIYDSPQRMLAENRVACSLTFDDGPHPSLDPQILDILDQHGIKATFYLVGQKVKQFPSVAKQIAQRGHEVAHHSYSHMQQTKLSAGGQEKDMRKTYDIIKNTVGIAPISYRPPYGSFNKTTQRLASQMGMSVVLWTVDPEDWRNRDAETIKQRVLGQYKTGDVILLHSLVPGTVQALPGIISGLKSKGCQRFVTASQWVSTVTAKR